MTPPGDVDEISGRDDGDAMTAAPAPVALSAPLPTIADVARAAGVSKTSVSRFLGGALSALSEDKRQQIESAIARLDYRPNRLARGLKRGQTRLIGFVVADVVNPYSVAVMHGAEAACRKFGYTMMLCNTGGSRELEHQVLDALASYSVEGIILHSVGEATGAIARLVPARVKLVLLDRRLPQTDYDFIGLDNSIATMLATRHLLENGYRDLAIFAEPLAGVSPRCERTAAFLAEVATEPAATGGLFEIDTTDETSTDRAVAAFMAANRQAAPKAILAASGIVTLCLLRALARAGIAIPDDVGVVGFDDLAWSHLVGTGITTIGQPTDKLGEMLVRQLLARIDGDTAPRCDRVVPGHLIIRGSSARR
ncbi:MAG: LacI family DNA-binding transcriptional regulator [Azospirillaceae bacterium]|nr:LacI family DNA-binding transcriptional regulator [Azospirillaceae bacterium]